MSFKKLRVLLIILLLSLNIQIEAEDEFVYSLRLGESLDSVRGKLDIGFTTKNADGFSFVSLQLIPGAPRYTTNTTLIFFQEKFTGAVFSIDPRITDFFSYEEIADIIKIDTHTDFTAVVLRLKKSVFVGLLSQKSGEDSIVALLPSKYYLQPGCTILLFAQNRHTVINDLKTAFYASKTPLLVSNEKELANVINNDIDVELSELILKNSKEIIKDHLILSWN